MSRQHNHHEHHFHHEHSHKEKYLFLQICLSLFLFFIVPIFHINGIFSILIYLTAYIIAGHNVICSAIKNLKQGDIFDENALMSIATLGAIAIKEYPEAIMVMVLYRIGEFFQHRAIEKSCSSITDLMDIRPDYANIEKDGKLQKISPYEITVGDIITVKAGEKIPLDGIVTEGSAMLDTSALTGESVPVSVCHNTEVLSGSININGLIKISVTKPFSESTVSKILNLVEHAADKKTKTENFITKFAKYYTPAVVGLALILALLPPILIEGAQFEDWFTRALTFLVISCPCALVISVPLTFFAGIGCASKQGILIKGSNYLEVISKLETVVFDKTGTLTQGCFEVSKIQPADENIAKNDLLKYAALAEKYSNHPIANALKSAYRENLETTDVYDVEEIAGCGIKAVVENSQVLAGNLALLEKFGILTQDVTDFGTIIHVAKNNYYLGYIVISDKNKPDAIETIKLLKNKVKNIIMLTGDSFNAASKTAKELGIEEFYAQLLPSGKMEKLEEVISKKSKNKTVAFVGDGINDAPVLTLADTGIAMGGIGSDAAIEAADIVIMDDNPFKIVRLIDISQKTILIVKENIIFSLFVKFLFLLLGALGLMTMWGAVFADVGVTFIAILNALRALHATNFIKK